MPTEFTLAEFAERVARREFCVWGAMRSVLSDSTGKRAARIERATTPLIAKHRAEYMGRHRIDEKTFLSPSVRIFDNYDTPAEREKEMMWQVSRDAREEAMSLSLERYRRQCAPAKQTPPIYKSAPRKRTLFDRLTAKVLAAMVQHGVMVTATHDGVGRRALTRVELQNAAIDLVNNALTVGQQAWSLVQIEIPDAAAPAVSPIGRAADDREIMSWMESHRRLLKQKGLKHGRDVVLKAAAERFAKPRKAMLAVWESGRSGRLEGSNAD